MKKRIISILLAVMMILTVLPVTLASANILGDVDGDGFVKAADARLALRASVGLENLNETEKKAADADFDGVIKAADARLILRASVGLENLHSHAYTKETITKAATCTVQGEKKLSCECGDFITEKIPVKAHTPVTDKAVAATCTATGKTEGSHCSVCNTVIKAQATINKIAHNYQLDKTTVIAATCQKDGYSGDKKCTMCKALQAKGTTVPSQGTEHVYETVTHNATCGQEGYTLNKCKLCDYYDEASYTKIADAKDHSFGSWKTVNPNCTEEGYDYRECSVCETIEKENFVAAEGHSYSWTETEAPTCKKTGSEKGVCSVCEDTVTRIKPITEHKTKEIHPENEPCRTIVKCEDCDFVKSDTIKHEKRSILATIVYASCEEDGSAFNYCANCNNYGKTADKDNEPKVLYEGTPKEEIVFGITEITDFATGHKPTSTNTIQKRTCTQDGIYEYTGACANGCGTNFTSETQIILPATGHSKGEVLTPTCTENVVCTNAHCDIPEKILEAKLGHDIQLSSVIYNEDITMFFCARCDEATKEDKNGEKIEQITLFNKLTDQVKTEYYDTFGLNIVSKESIKTSYSKFDFGMFTSQIKDMYEDEMANTPDDYSAVAYTWGSSLPLKNQNQISKLTKNDIDSISIERFSGVNFNDILSSFNTTYENIKNETNRNLYITRLNNLKNSSVSENVIKVVIDVKNESYRTLPKTPTETALQRVYDFNIYEEAKTLQNSSFEESGISMATNLTDIKTDAQVTYYFLESTYEPIIAVYDTNVIITQEIDMSFSLGLFSLNGEMDPIIETTNTTVYAFPKFISKGN